MRLIVLAASLIFLAAAARAQDVAPAPAESALELDQVIYKGVAGNFLETLPIAPRERVSLQRANAVVSSPMAGRSLALLLGVSGPAFIVGGLIWGIWSAMHIEAPKPDTSWLGIAERPGIGFCNGSASKACKLHLRHEAAGPAEPTS